MPEVKEVELTVPQGTTFIYRVQLNDPETNLPINVTGWTAKFRAGDKLNDDIVDYEATELTHITITGNLGIFELKIPDTVTDSWTKKKLKFNFDAISTTGEVVRMTKGVLVLDYRV